MRYVCMLCFLHLLVIIKIIILAIKYSSKLYLAIPQPFPGLGIYACKIPAMKEKS